MNTFNSSLVPVKKKFHSELLKVLDLSLRPKGCCDRCCCHSVKWGQDYLIGRAIEQFDLGRFLFISLGQTFIESECTGHFARHWHIIIFCPKTAQQRRHHLPALLEKAKVQKQIICQRGELEFKLTTSDVIYKNYTTWSFQSLVTHINIFLGYLEHFNSSLYHRMILFVGNLPHIPIHIYIPNWFFFTTLSSYICFIIFFQSLNINDLKYSLL